MESFFQKRKLAREYVRQLLQSNLNAESRHQMFEALKQFRRRNISPSSAVATVHNLLRDNADLLPAFDPFMPKINSIVAAEEEDSILHSSFDFLNRVRTRFADDSRIYKDFLNCLHSHSLGESSFSEIYDRVIRLFGNNPDLVSDFKSFLLLSSSDQQQISCKKRKSNSPISSDQKRNCKKRKADSPTSSDKKSCKKRKTDKGATEKTRRFSDSRRKQERIKSNNKEIDNCMEDSLFEVDVELGNVREAHTNAEQLKERFSDGRISPADVRLDEHFTALNMVCIRRTYTKFFDDYENPISAMRELIGRLMRKEKELEESREKICEKWNRIRQSRDPNWIYVI